MQTEQIIELNKELILGKGMDEIYPCGESHKDAQTLKDVNQLIEVQSDLLWTLIKGFNDSSNHYEGSIKEINKTIKEALMDSKNIIDDVLNNLESED